MSSHSRSGFSLFELSIVLLIIGLLAAGIVTGDALLKASEIRGFIKDFGVYHHAHNTFYDRFGQGPGDFDGATDLWGAADADPATCVTVVGISAAGTCNGNGNGQYEWLSTDASRIYSESFLAWQHLALANILSIPATGQTDILRAGLNAPVTGRSSTTFMFGYYRVYNRTENGLRLLRSVNAPYSDKSNISVDEAAGIDGKIDDGIANSGNVYGTGTSGGGGGNQCTGRNYNDANGADYLRNSSDFCTLTLFLDSNS